VGIDQKQFFPPQNALLHLETRTVTIGPCFVPSIPIFSHNAFIDEQTAKVTRIGRLNQAEAMIPAEFFTRFVFLLTTGSTDKFRKIDNYNQPL
jgi:hypothetical protein